MEDWVSLREFARRRGVTLHAVQRAIATGRVSGTAVRRSTDGRITGIEANQATAQWNASTDPIQAARTTSTLERAVAMTAPAPALAVAAPAPETQPARQLEIGEARDPGPGKGGAADEPKDRDPNGYYAARADRERYAAKQAELDYHRALGNLVSTEDLRRVAERRYRAMRDALLAIPDQVAPILAAEKDPLVVRERLDDVIKKALHELSSAARAEVARGAEERMGA